MARKTEEAANKAWGAHGSFMGTSNNFASVRSMSSPNSPDFKDALAHEGLARGLDNIAESLYLIAQSIGDVYDKLREIERKGEKHR